MKRSEYIEFKWLAILLVAGILMTCPNLVASLPLDSFYPYDVGDNKTNVSDDESSQPIELYVGFPFFNKTYSRIYVNNNGIISFNDKISTFKPQNFNDSDFDIRLPLVAPFWADVDIEHPKGLNGTIVYRLVDDKRLDHEILNRASQDVKTYFKGNSKFSAKIVLIVTWYEVGFYGALMDGQLKRNTFQTVLISDGRHSYAIFNYKKISWTTGTSGGGDELTGLSTLDGKPAVVGLYSGWESYYIVPQSGTPAVFNITNTTNVDIPGRYMFRIDGPEVDDRSSMVSKVEQYTAHHPAPPIPVNSPGDCWCISKSNA